MTTNTVSLSDGSLGTTVNLWEQGKIAGIQSAASIGDKIWLLREGSTFITIRSCENGEVIKKVDLCDEGICLQVIGAMEGNNVIHRIWVSAVSTKIYIFMEDGSLLGHLQTSDSHIHMVTKMFPMPLEGGNIMFTSGPGKDVTMWDTQHFNATKSYFGKTPGEVVTAVAPCDSESVVICVSTTESIRLFSRHRAEVVASIETSGASAIFVDYSFAPHNFVSYNASDKSNGILVGYLWAAHMTVVTIYAIVITPNSDPKGDLPDMALIQSNVLPCPYACQITRSVPSHVSIISSDGMVSIWSLKSFTLSRTFKAGNVLDDGSNEIFSRDGKKKHKGHFTIIPALTKSSRLFWTLNSDVGKALLWYDTVLSTEAEFSPDLEVSVNKIQSITSSAGPVGQTRVSKDNEEKEILFFRRKLKYLENMITLYRQKVRTLFRENGYKQLSLNSESGQEGVMQFVLSFEEIDKAYQEVFARYEQQTLDQEPLLEYHAECNIENGKEPISLSTESFIDYWKRKYYSVLTDIQQINLEYESIIDLFLSCKPLETDGSMSTITAESSKSLSMGCKKSIDSEDIRRAQYVCQLIREKKTSMIRERLLVDDIAQLRATLRKSNTSLGSSVDNDYETLNTTLREEVNKLKLSLHESEDQIRHLQGQAKQNILLKARINKMQKQLDDSKAIFSDRTVDMQRDIDLVVDKLYSAKTIIETREKELKTAEILKCETDVLIEKMNQDIELLHQTIDNLKEDAKKYQSADDDAIRRLKDEIHNLCEAISDRDNKIMEWKDKYDDTNSALQEMETKLLSSQFITESKNNEISFMTERISNLESILSDRKVYAATISEVQCKLEYTIERLKDSVCTLSPQEYATSIEKLEYRMSNLQSIEQQLKHKDDLIALKDDELQQIREKSHQLQQQVSQISSVFFQLPKSIEEVESMIIELDEYRRHLGGDMSIQRKIRERLASFQNKRRPENNIVSKDNDLFFCAEKNKEEKLEKERLLERAQAIAETLKAVASRSLIKVNKLT